MQTDLANNDPLWWEKVLKGSVRWIQADLLDLKLRTVALAAWLRNRPAWAARFSRFQQWIHAGKRLEVARIGYEKEALYIELEKRGLGSGVTIEPVELTAEYRLPIGDTIVFPVRRVEEDRYAVVFALDVAPLFAHFDFDATAFSVATQYDVVARLLEAVPRDVPLRIEARSRTCSRYPQRLTLIRKEPHATLWQIAWQIMAAMAKSPLPIETAPDTIAQAAEMTLRARRMIHLLHDAASDRWIEEKLVPRFKGVSGQVGEIQDATTRMRWGLDGVGELKWIRLEADRHALCLDADRALDGYNEVLRWHRGASAATRLPHQYPNVLTPDALYTTLEKWLRKVH